MGVDRRTFPLVGTGRTLPLPFVERTFPLPYFRGTRFKRQYMALVEVDWDSGTEYYSFDGVRFADAFYEDFVSSVGTIRREVMPLAGDYSIAECEIRLLNVRRDPFNLGNPPDSPYFSQLRYGAHWRNRVVRVLFGDALDGENGFTVVYTGTIIDWRFENGEVVLVVRDPSYDRFRLKVTNTLSTVNATVFPNKPGYLPPYLVPLVYGTVSSAGLTDDGALPAYPIDPAIGQAKYRYAAAHGEIKAITNVYVYGVIQGAGYTVGTAVYGGRTFTVIDFDADPRDAARRNEIEVTWDGLGLTDDGTASGGLLVTPTEQLDYFLEDYAGVDASEIDNDLLFAEEDRDLANGYIAALVVVDPNETYQQIIGKWSESFMKLFFATRLGLFGVYGFVASETEPDPTYDLTDATEILESSFSIGANQQVASHLEYGLDFHWARSLSGLPYQWSRERIGNFVGEAANLGQTILQRSNFYYCRDVATADAVAESRLELMVEDLERPAWKLPIQFYSMDLNNFAALTHWLGIGVYGYEQVNARVVGLQIDVQPTRLDVGAKALRRNL